MKSPLHKGRVRRGRTTPTPPLPPRRLLRDRTVGVNIFIIRKKPLLATRIARGGRVSQCSRAEQRCWGTPDLALPSAGMSQPISKHSQTQGRRRAPRTGLTYGGHLPYTRPSTKGAKRKMSINSQTITAINMCKVRP